MAAAGRKCPRDTVVPNKLSVRWCLRRDVDACVENERLSVPDPWEHEDFEICLRSKNSNGMVIDDGRNVLGHVMFISARGRITLVSVVVHPDHRRKGLGSRLLAPLVRRIGSPSSLCRSIDVTVSDRLLGPHLFFRHNGFLATEVKHHHFGPDHDGYRFSRSVDSLSSFERALGAKQ